ncbi:MAG: hypothetical protein H0U77_04835 [Nocardioidaceae bacterium]|jgi:hypothetical protein|nr:hypothetical protein [Nocardioidaceae bacterium]
MRRFADLYGASPLHLLAMLASVALAGYAALELFSSEPILVLVWFVGAAIGHDLVLLPLYALVDMALVRSSRRRRVDEVTARAVPWVNYVRVPLLVSGLLLLVYFPSILRLSSGYETTTNLSADPYLGRWLLVSGVVFVASAAAYALRLRRSAPG